MKLPALSSNAIRVHSQSRWNRAVFALSCSTPTVCDNYHYACYQDCGADSGCQACCDAKQTTCLDDSNCQWPLTPTCVGPDGTGALGPF